jgi:hypothetical protein
MTRVKYARSRKRVEDTVETGGKKIVSCKHCDMAEGVRFELTRERNPLPVFKTGALNHSATLP